MNFKFSSSAAWRSAAAIMALPLMVATAAADSEMTDFAFEIVDPGFCIMPPAEVTDAQLRDMRAEQADDLLLTGEIEGPVEAGLYGGGFFARGAERNAVASSLHAMIIPDEGEIAALCLVVVPVNEMDSTEGDVVLRGPDADPEDGDYYMVFARMLGRDSDGSHVIADLEAGEGVIDFAEDRGEMIDGTMSLSGDLSDGKTLQIAFTFSLIEDEHLRFLDLSGD
ncbi:MAG: hypothetical protein JJU21_01840 [Salinarimonas sp.]|nr:hypothetical protein [Salinarimonas sp.]